MPSRPLEFRCLLVSPGDLDAERDAVVNAILSWNAHVGPSLNARIQPVRWESHGRPDLAGEPQKMINQQLVDDCDLAIAFFWSRLGTPTSSNPSGSIEEIARLQTRGAPVLIYFGTKPIPPDRIQIDQLRQLKIEESRLQKEGLPFTFDSAEHLQHLVSLHLTGHIRDLMARGSLAASTHQALIGAPAIYECAGRLCRAAQKHIRLFIDANTPKPRISDELAGIIVTRLRASRDQGAPVVFEPILGVDLENPQPTFRAEYEKRAEVYAQVPGLERPRLLSTKSAIGFEIWIFDRTSVLIGIATLAAVADVRIGLLFDNRPDLAGELTDWFDHIVKPQSETYEDWNKATSSKRRAKR